MSNLLQLPCKRCKEQQNCEPTQIVSSEHGDTFFCSCVIVAINKYYYCLCEKCKLIIESEKPKHTCTIC